MAIKFKKHNEAKILVYTGGTNLAIQQIIDTSSEEKKSPKEMQDNETLPHHFHGVASETN